MKTAIVKMNGTNKSELVELIDRLIDIENNAPSIMEQSIITDMIEILASTIQIFETIDNEDVLAECNLTLPPLVRDIKEFIQEKVGYDD